jgi:cytochrome oxidase Cu insertion factor (SCO1/SenC/PrrC family)
MKLAGAALLVLCCASSAHLCASNAEAGPLYDAPAPGSYELPAIARVHPHALVDSNGATASFPKLAKGQVAVVAFMYRGCHEAQGCPASLALLRSLDRKLEADPARAARVRLACVSFDPANDTPERMRELREMMEPRTDWEFLSPGDPALLEALLADYGQDATPLENGAYRHVLKVFLVDDALRVRNVYSAGLLDPELVIADIDTVTGP